MKPLIYLAGPYRRPDPVSNTARAMRAGRQLRDDLGLVPIIPHLSLFEHLQEPASDQYWLDATMDLMRGCDAVYRFSMDYSSGSDAEVAEAERLGIPVFYTLPALADWARQRRAYCGVSDGRADSTSADDSRRIEDEWR